MWLYYATDGRWHFGSGSAAAQHLPGHRLRSRECKVGTLPVDISGWEVRDSASGSRRPSSVRQPGSSEHGWSSVMPSCVAVPHATRLVRIASDDWSWCKDVWSVAAAVEISGSRCGDADGCYELQHCRTIRKIVKADACRSHGACRSCTVDSAVRTTRRPRAERDSAWQEGVRWVAGIQTPDGKVLAVFCK